METFASEAVIAARHEEVFVAWRDTRYFERGSIFFKRSIDNGNSWSENLLLSPNNVRSAAPTMAVDGDTISVASEHYDLGCGNTRLRRSADAGATWSEPLDATREEEALGGGGGPSLAIGENHKLNLVHVSLKDAGETRHYIREIYHKASLDNGNTWCDDTRLTNDIVGDSRFPISPSYGSNLHVVWYDDRDDTSCLHFGYPPLISNLTTTLKCTTNDILTTELHGKMMSDSLMLKATLKGLLRQLSGNGCMSRGRIIVTGQMKFISSTPPIMDRVGVRICA